MSKKQRRRNGRKSGNGPTVKETGDGSRYIVVAGEDFTDLTQPSQKEVRLGKIKKGLMWIGVVVVSALISALVTALVTVLLEKLSG